MVLMVPVFRISKLCFRVLLNAADEVYLGISRILRNWLNNMYALSQPISIQFHLQDINVMVQNVLHIVKLD